MAKAVMIQGTTSDAGKSLFTAGLCRIFAEDGYKVAPFKAQNMASNSYITRDGLEIARSCAVQAWAAGKEPDVRMNPVLLKPVSDQGSEVIVAGVSQGIMPGRDFYTYRETLRQRVRESYTSLGKENDIIVIEGAGSPAEINLKQNDIVNMGMAKMAEAPVLLVGDIDRGGVFASLAGTMLLLDADEREIVKGLAINKFRGDLSLLLPGVKMIEDILQRPVVGVVPYMDINLEPEDSLSQYSRLGAGAIKIGIIALPRASNLTEFHSFAAVKGLRVEYITRPSQLEGSDLLIVPGTNNPIDDMGWLSKTGLATGISDFAHGGGQVVGVAGGYQMLATSFTDKGSTADGIGIIEGKIISQRFDQPQRITASVGGKGSELLGGATLEAEGYQAIRFTLDSSEAPHLIPGGYSRGCVTGTEFHGLFENEGILKRMVETLSQGKGIDSPSPDQIDLEGYREAQFAILSEGLREHLDLEKIYDIIDKGI